MIAERIPTATEMANALRERMNDTRAQVEALRRKQEQEHAEALRLADELEQEANALRDAAGGVALVVKTETPPKAMSKPKVKPTKPTKRGEHQPHAGKLRPGTVNARIVGLLADPTFDGRAFHTEDIAARLLVPDRKPIIHAACVKLARRGHIERVAPGTYRVKA